MVFKILDMNKNPTGLLQNYNNLKIETDLDNADKKLSFTYLIKENDIRNEYYIQTETDEFVVKGVKRKDEDTQEITAVMNVEDLDGMPVPVFNTNGQSFRAVADVAVEGTGWTADVPDYMAEKVRALRIADTDVYQLCKKIAIAFFCEVWFDTLNKVVHYTEEIGEDKGVYFMRSLNLVSLDVSMDTTDYYTQIHPVGKDGITIESVNDGKAYLQNFQYSNKVRTYYWVDENYTDPTALKEDAEKKLKDLSAPCSSYSASIIDLASQKPEYSILSYKIGDKVTLIDDITGQPLKRRIKKMTEYPQNPENNTCELSNAVPTFEELQKKWQEASQLVEDLTGGTGIILGSRVAEFTIVKDGMNYVVGQVNDLNKWKVLVSSQITKDGIINTVGNYYVNQDDIKEVNQKLTTTETKATQAADHFSWLVKSGTSSTNFELTDRTAELIADHINLMGLVEFNGLSTSTQEMINRISEISGKALTAANDVKKSAISGVDVLYASGESENAPPAEGWDTTAPQWEEGRYIWQKTVTTYASGEILESEPTNITGARGKEGDAGIGVDDIGEQYYLSDSPATQTGGEWTIEQPEWSKGKYIWTRSAITWTDGTTTYTTPVLAQAINSANYTANDAYATAENTKKLTQELDDQIAEWCYNNNRTFINGAKIYTGTIKAKQIDTEDLFAQTIEATGTIKGLNLIGGSLTIGNTNGIYAAITKSGKLVCQDGTFIGNVVATSLTSQNTYSLYYNPHQEILLGGSGETVKDIPNQSTIIASRSWGTGYKTLLIGPELVCGDPDVEEVDPEWNCDCGLEIAYDSYYGKVVRVIGDRITASGTTYLQKVICQNTLETPVFKANYDTSSYYLAPNKGDGELPYNIGTSGNKWDNIWGVKGHFDSITLGGVKKTEWPSGGGGISGSLTITTNGSTKLSKWTGGSAATIDIDYSDVGAAPAGNYLTSSSLSGYATQTWVRNNALTGKIVGGGVTITPSAANTPTSKYVSYSFGSTPNVVACPQTSVPGSKNDDGNSSTRVLGVGVTSISSSGCYIWINRTNTTATIVQYLAYA